MESILNYINGEFKPSSSNEWMDVYEPATGKKYAQLTNSNEQDVLKAIDAAEAAKDAWANLPQHKRSSYLFAMADAIDAAMEELALAETKDNGKPISLSKTVDIPRAAANFRYYAGAALHQESDAHDMGNLAFNYTLRKPLGTVVCISPWNLPLYLFSWKIAPALATGNCVIAKPSEVTPLTAYLLTKIADKVGLPKGVLNVIHGEGIRVGNTLSTHKKIKAVSFTGGTQTGSTIAGLAAPLFKKLSLELGGKNPNIIFADAPYEEMLTTTVRSSFSNQGQICLCGSRILIEESIYEQFKTDFVAKVKALQLGSPYDKETSVGAVVSKSHQAKILSCIDKAVAEGGTILLGGKKVTLAGELAGGYYVEPTIIEGLSQQCATNQEEIFGPVVTLAPFKTLEEAIEMANNNDYGLSASVWTSNQRTAHRVAKEVDAGMVWINTWLLRDLRTPFGGVKNSGVGREGGKYALSFFTEPKNVCFSY
ncbi:MAG: aminomuconate-semialdehyde/2-hydroxymuconate-6-semialdehyde dehydrogenase [Flavobacteriales bacterium]|jgi:aminomuconate-semialdehyde/2-hydroxymuconate-6-semialdehyde dehydrogenase